MIRLKRSFKTNNVRKGFHFQINCLKDMSFLLLICIFNLFSSYIAETDPIKFYEDLINAATKEADNYKLPTDASRFIPKNSSTVKSKMVCLFY